MKDYRIRPSGTSAYFPKVGDTFKDMSDAYARLVNKLADQGWFLFDRCIGLDEKDGTINFNRFSFFNDHKDLDLEVILKPSQGLFKVVKVKAYSPVM